VVVQQALPVVCAALVAAACGKAGSTSSTSGGAGPVEHVSAADINQMMAEHAEQESRHRHVVATVVATTVDRIAAGPFHTCALLKNHTVKCWGRNGEGQLGDGTAIDTATPVVVKSLSGAVQIAAGNNHTCALLTD